MLKYVIIVSLWLLVLFLFKLIVKVVRYRRLLETYGEMSDEELDAHGVTYHHGMTFNDDGGVTPHTAICPSNTLK